MEDENKRKNKIIITTAVIIIFVLMIAIIIFLITNMTKNKNNSDSIIRKDNETISANESTTNESMKAINNTIIDNSEEYLNKKYGKVEIIWIDANNRIIDKPLAPNAKDMNPVKYDESSTTFYQTTADDSEWYNYSNKIWANAIDKNGSYFVWIPRYAYKITYYSDNTYTKEIGYSDYRGILKLNTDKTLTRISNNSKGLIEIGNHYILAPAFMKDTASGFKNGGWDVNLSGIWISKYEMSMETNGTHTDTNNQEIGNVPISANVKAVSKPGISSWRNITIGNSYYNSYNYNRTLESHLIKNSEWGAITYLAYSKYGRNANEITNNKSSQYITGNSRLESEIYNYKGNESTTGNATGVYDLSGNAWEYTATFINNGYPRTNEYGGYLEGYLCENTKNTKYKTVYSNDATDNGIGTYNSSYANKNYSLNSQKRGDAIFETSTSGYGSDAWNTNSSFFMQQDVPFLIRGGDFGSGAGAGLFSYNGSNGQANAGESYRIVLAI